MRSKEEILADSQAHLKRAAGEAEVYAKPALTREAGRAEKDYQKLTGRTLAPIELRK